MTAGLMAQESEGRCDAAAVQHGAAVAEDR